MASVYNRIFLNISGFSRRFELDKGNAWFNSSGKPKPPKEKKPKFASEKGQDGVRKGVSRKKSPTRSTSDDEQAAFYDKDNSHIAQSIFPSPYEDNARTSQPVFPSPNEDVPGSPQHDRHAQPSSVFAMLPHQGAIPLTSQSHHSGESGFSGAFPLISSMPFLGLNTNTSNSWPQYP